jgi:hypothetical protein
MALEQLDFVRYYSVTLLSESLFCFTTAVTVFGLTQYIRRGATRGSAPGGPLRAASRR